MKNEAGVILIIKDGLILAVSRKNNPNKWGLSGGKCEENESPKEAAIRETFEETGIVVKSCEQIYKRTESNKVIDGFPFQAYCFYATEWEGSPEQKEEGKVKWITADELTSNDQAFPEYNINAVYIFRKLYPDVFLK